MIIDCHQHYCPPERRRQALEQGHTIIAGRYDSEPPDLVNSGVITGAWILSVNTTVYGLCTDEEMLALCRQYPDFFVPFGYLDFDEAGPERIDYLFKAGCVGLKAIFPGKAYDDPAFFPHYERAQHYGMPVLYHLGGSPYHGKEYTRLDPAKRELSKYMHVMTIDAVAKTFPALPLVLGHLGGLPCDFELALYITTGNPNVYLELSCNETQLENVKRAARQTNSQGQFGGKLLFGTDSPWKEVVGKARFWEGFFTYVCPKPGGGPEVARRIMGENAARIIAEARAKQAKHRKQ